MKKDDKLQTQRILQMVFGERVVNPGRKQVINPEKWSTYDEAFTSVMDTLEDEREKKLIGLRLGIDDGYPRMLRYRLRKIQARIRKKVSRRISRLATITQMRQFVVREYRNMQPKMKGN